MKLHVVGLLLFEQIKKEGRNESGFGVPRCMSGSIPLMFAGATTNAWTQPAPCKKRGSKNMHMEEERIR